MEHDLLNGPEAPSGLRVSVLGPLRVEVDGAEVRVGPQLLQLLAALTLDAPRVVGDEALIERIWGADPPNAGKTTLQVLVGRLRKALEPASGRGDWTTVVREGPGYRLAVAEGAIDRDVLVGATSTAAALLPDRPADALGLLDRALSMFRGDPWADVAHAEWVADELSLIDRTSSRARRLRVDALLALGRDEAIHAARSLVDDEPFDEGLRHVLALALYRAGRQREALAELEAIRRSLRDELGLDLSPDLRSLERAILDHDPRLGSDERRGATPLFGRAALVEELRATVAGSRLTTLTGPGGCGKTRLALEVASRMEAEFPDGVWFVDLDGLGERDDVAGELARVLDLRDPDEDDGSGAAVVLDQVCRYAATRTMLIVLDNCERVLDPVLLTATRLVDAAPAVKIITTSRQKLGARQESVVTITPLDVPPPDATVDQIRACPAVRLLVAGGGRTELDRPEHLEDLALLAGALDGMPLALELAASRLRTSSPAELRAEMSDRFDLLVAPADSQPRRHPGVRASFDLSYDLLGRAEREMLARLGLVSGSFTLDLFGAPGDLTRVEALSALDRLVAASLVERVETGGLAGYHLLETTRAYARLRLEDEGGEAAAIEWFASRVLEFARRARMQLRTGTQRDTLAVIDANYAALRGLLDLAIDAGQGRLVAQILVELSSYWYVHPHRGDASRLIERARATLDPATDEVLLAELLVAQADTERGRRNFFELLREPLGDALHVLDAARSDEAFLFGSGLLIIDAIWHGDLARSSQLREAAAGALARSTRWHASAADLFEGLETAIGGDLAGGLELLDRAFDAFLDLGDRAFAARVSYYKALGSELVGDHQGVREHLLTSVALSELAGGCGIDGRISLGLADSAAQDDDPRAEPMLQRAADLLERQGDVVGMARCRREVARLVAARGHDDDRALALFAESLPVLASLEPPSFALGLVEAVPLLRRRAPSIAPVALALATQLAERYADHSSPDLRRFHEVVTELAPDDDGPPVEGSTDDLTALLLDALPSR